MRKVTHISLRRAEGPSAECTVGWAEFADFDAANDQLKTWAETAPDTGGYDKCDFVVFYDGAEMKYTPQQARAGETDDGAIYEGRFDLQRDHARGGNLLQDHIRDFIMWYFDVRDGFLVLG